MYKRLFILLGILVVGGYAFASWKGLEFRHTEKSYTRNGIRGAHGGRSFWYYGYHGGK